MQDWEIVIGLETHVQIATQSKLFSTSATTFGVDANQQTDFIDAALPGVLPVVNAQAKKMAIRFGLAVGGEINRHSIFARKHYFYPDLPKGYQISQFDQPVVLGGAVKIATRQGEKVVPLVRAHLEEDAGKSIHDRFGTMTGIDLNRAGVPLLEIVTEPELRGAAEAVAYAKVLHNLVRWIAISDGNMQEGSFRCDANVSIRRYGDPQLGTRTEIKNLNSFRFMEQAIEYEAQRQWRLRNQGGQVVQETRLFDVASGETRAMRSKEDAHDYRYFPDPDLLPLIITTEEIAAEKNTMPELPDVTRLRYQTELAISEEMARILTANSDTARYFDQCVSLAGQDCANQIANWMTGELTARLRKSGTSWQQQPLASHQLADVVRAIKAGSIAASGARKIIDTLWLEHNDRPIAPLIDELGVRLDRDDDALEQWVEDSIAANAKAVAQYKEGKSKALNALVGMVMKASKGSADPALVREKVIAKLTG